MKTVVTGGAGFIGSHLVDALVDRGDSVVVIDNLHRGRVEHIEYQIESGAVVFVEGDIRDGDALRRWLAGADVIYHLAAQSNVMGAMDNVDYSFTTNVLGTFELLKAAKEEGVPRVVFSSSREVYGEQKAMPVAESATLNAKNLYGASKLAGEAYCRAWERTAGTTCSVLRLANVYGPRDTDRVIPLWLDRATRGDDLVIYGGTQVLDFVWIDIAVKSLIAAAMIELDGPVNVGSGQGTTLQELARAVTNLTGSKSRVRMEPARAVEVTKFIAATDRMQRILGIPAPAHPLEHMGFWKDQAVYAPAGSAP